MTKPVSTIRDQLRRHSVALISLCVALSSLGYNTWRNELTESNRNVRAAGFEMTLTISELHEALFVVHYSNDEADNNLKKGWAFVLALRDLSAVMPKDVQNAADTLMATWEKESGKLGTSEASVNLINGAIDDLRQEILLALEALR